MHDLIRRGPKPAVLTAEQAAALVNDGATVAVGGLISVLCPEKILAALEQRFRTTGQPRDLTVVTPVRVGWQPGTGLEHFTPPGMLRRLVSGSFSDRDSPALAQLVAENQIEAYSFSMGTLFEWLRAIGSGQPGWLTPVGVGTYLDPRHGGGRQNECAREDFVRLVTFEGEEYLFYPARPIDVAIIRATTADERGNLTLEDEPVTLGGLEIAMAARASGGLVIAQVKRRAAAHTLPARNVAVPGIFVDAVVVDPEQRQSLLPDNAAWTGSVRAPRDELTQPLPLDVRKVILRRAAQEIRPGDVVNLGVGIPVGLPQLALEENWLEDITFSLEHGAVGGVPTGEEVFGAHWNPDAFLSSPQVFEFYHGGGLSVSLLGFAQVDGAGNVNVSRFNGRFRGSGGFIDICHRTQRLVFCGTLTTGGLDAVVDDGRLSIRREGRVAKFVPLVEHLTFNAHQALKRGQSCLYVTERAVFRLGPNGLVLTEYAPGVDVRRDILDRIGCRAAVDPAVRPMDAHLFRADKAEVGA